MLFCIISYYRNPGAGDIFYGCVLGKILEYGKTEFEDNEFTEILQFDNAGASIITTQKSALKVMPTPDEVEKLLQ